VDKTNNKTKDFLLDLLFPKFCLGCQKEDFYLCQDCRSILDISEYDYCLCSTKPLRLAPLTEGNFYGKCQRCQNKKLSGLFSALPYKEKHLTKKLIYQFKYQPYLKDLAKTLAGILIEHFIVSGNNTNHVWENGILVPVPLDKKKLKFRGYNQSEELAKELALVLKIPVIAGNLIKIKVTKPQMELSQAEREKNLEGAFKIPTQGESASGGKNPFRDKKIFLVDDVYTTGSTMEECAKTLRGAGAKSVWGIVFAREEQ